jgi:CRP-like cAMP-binding protein
MLNLIDKVLLLQEVDLFAEITSENLGYLAGIAEEIQAEGELPLFREGHLPDAFFVVVEGKVRLEKDGNRILESGAGDVLGAWALFDQEPNLSSAVAEAGSVLLKVEREAFFDLLADHRSVTQGILKALARRVRRLAGRVGGGI